MPKIHGRPSILYLFNKFEYDVFVCQNNKL